MPFNLFSCSAEAVLCCSCMHDILFSHSPSICRRGPLTPLYTSYSHSQADNSHTDKQTQKHVQANTNTLHLFTLTPLKTCQSSARSRQKCVNISVWGFAQGLCCLIIHHVWRLCMTRMTPHHTKNWKPMKNTTHQQVLSWNQWTNRRTRRGANAMEVHILPTWTLTCTTRRNNSSVQNPCFP